MKSGNLQVPIHLTNSDKYSNTNKKNKYKPRDFWDEIKILNKKTIIIEPNKIY